MCPVSSNLIRNRIRLPPTSPSPPLFAPTGRRAVATGGEQRNPWKPRTQTSAPAGATETSQDQPLPLLPAATPLSPGPTSTPSTPKSSSPAPPLSRARKGFHSKSAPPSPTTSPVSAPPPPPSPHSP